jgi:hypothetical protein
VYFNLHPVSAFRRLQRLSVWNSQAGNGLYAERARVGQRYIRGRGVEFGALHTPLPVPHEVSVRYADLASADILRTAYADVGPIRAPDMFSDLGPVEVHRELMTAAVRWIMAWKLWSVLSARRAMRLNSLSLQKKFSIR